MNEFEQEFVIHAKNKVMFVDLVQDEINYFIQREYQVGWRVKQIIHIDSLNAVALLFERD